MVLRNDAIARGAVAGSGHARMAAAVSTGCGPISNSIVHLRSASVRTLLANSTGWRAWRRQYGAVQFRAPAERGAGTVAHQCLSRRTELEAVRKRLEFVEDRIQQRRVECVAGVEPVTANTVGFQPATACSRSCPGPDSTVLAPL